MHHSGIRGDSYHTSRLTFRRKLATATRSRLTPRDNHPSSVMIQTVPTASPALTPEQLLRSVDATRGTLRKPPMKLIELVARVCELTGDRPYAVVGGLAQILWARKSHTDDLDVVVAASDLQRAYETVRAGGAPSWTLPSPPDSAREADAIFEVCHLLYEGCVVDLIAFASAELNEAIVSTAHAVPEFDGIRFIRPELLLVTHLLRPGSRGALAAVELAIARRSAGLDLIEVRRWASLVQRGDRLERVLEQAAVFDTM